VAFKRFADRKDPQTSKLLKKLQDEFKDGVAGADISVEKESEMVHRLESLSILKLRVMTSKCFRLYRKK
jgi:hypothetical protein